MWSNGEWLGGKEGSGSLATQVFEVEILPKAKRRWDGRESTASSDKRAFCGEVAGKRDLESEGSQGGGSCIAGAAIRMQLAQ